MILVSGVISFIFRKDYDQGLQKDSLVIPLLLWVALNVASVGIASILTAYVEVVFRETVLDFFFFSQLSELFRTLRFSINYLIHFW